MINRLPAAVFAALAAATVGAFFLTQHLKVENPFINGLPRVDPPAINPLAGRVCESPFVKKRVSFKTARVGFYLQTSAQRVDVFVEGSDGQLVATARGSGRYVRPGPDHYVFYSWNGHVPGGGVAPDGSYHFVASLPSQDRTVPVGGPFQVITVPPHPQVTSVTASGRQQPGPAIIGPPVAGRGVTIHFTPGDYRDSQIKIIRTDLPGGPRVVFSYGAGRRGEIGWNGEITGTPAPAGTYLVGVRVVDRACNVGRFPPLADPPPGLTPHAGVTVRYLAAQPPLVPVTAGTQATVFVDSRRQPYSWELFAAGRPKVLGRGSVGAAQAATGTGPVLRVGLPPRGADVYELALRSGPHHTVVPLIAAAGGRRAAAKVLVVLPALTWEGRNPVDDTGDGLPATLTAGDRIDLERPFVGGLPAGLTGELGTLHFLERQRDTFQLTTDVALAEGVGPQLAGHRGVLLDGSLAWLPSGLIARLRAFAKTGGRVVSIGTDSMQAQAPVRGGAGVAVPTAGPPARLSPDPFGARHGGLVAHTPALITVLDDQLGIFGVAPAFPGFSAYQQIAPPAGSVTSEAGVATGIPAIVGFRLGAGTVVEIGLSAFGERLPVDIDAQDLLARLWRLLDA